MRLSLFAEIFNMLLMTIILGVAVYLLVLIVKALKKYINSKEIREEKSIIQRSLGEELKAQRLRCKMTQEFVADALGVSRDVACLAFQFGDGLSNLLWPTSNIVVVCALGDIPYEKWLKWFIPLFFILLVAQCLLVSGAVMLGM